MCTEWTHGEGCISRVAPPWGLAYWQHVGAKQLTIALRHLKLEAVRNTPVHVFQCGLVLKRTEWSTLTLDLQFYLDGRIYWVFSMNDTGVQRDHEWLWQLIWQTWLKPSAGWDFFVSTSSHRMNVSTRTSSVGNTMQGLGDRLAQILQRWSRTLERTAVHVIRINNHEASVTKESISSVLFHYRSEDDEDNDDSE